MVAHLCFMLWSHSLLLLRMYIFYVNLCGVLLYVSHILIICVLTCFMYLMFMFVCFFVLPG